MAEATIDHIISLIVFIGVILLFVSLFGQTIQTGIVYQQHQAVATKCSDLLDNMLLNPGSPSNWGQSDSAPTSFGVQSPEFTQYELSAFSLMRLDSSTGSTVEYDKTSPNIYYNSIPSGPGAFLLTSYAQALNYSTALTLLGINNTYGFQLTLTPDLSVSITESHASSPLNLSISVSGTGFPFAGATINYCLILVTLGQNDAEYPSYIIQTGTTITDQTGLANVLFTNVTDPNQVYAFIAYAHLDGIVGVGYHTRVSETNQYVVPVLQDVASQEVALANSYDLNNSNSLETILKYNATFVILKDDYTLSKLPLDSQNSVNITASGSGNPVPSIYLPSYTNGILIITYQQKGSAQGGIAMMPWGVSSLAFPVTFGGNPQQQGWVATDMRQVMIGGVSYQAKLSLWSDQEIQVTG